ncbi:acetate/propionate family kinase [Puia sp.]|jgi:acetate kinase|uniref:acetate/propionate family kinase n=1 Tax=Puia sp. TaxID=2045100 RepID=UPI002F4237B6
MNTRNKNILAVNGGSSSIKFSLYSGDDPPVKWLSGKITRIGLVNTELTFTNKRTEKNGRLPVKASGIAEAAGTLADWLQEVEGVMPLAAIGHRVVHGLQHRQAALVDDALLDDLRRISAYDPDHLPGEIELIRCFGDRYPHLPQIACFDTAFHSSLPPVARVLPIPRRYAAAGLQRYGFHGLSYSYILEELMRIAGARVANGAVVLAHLGNGASLAAIKDGVSVDTTMGFTPVGGIVMGTRPGDLDPGVLWWLLDKEKLGADGFSQLINRECGLLGVSETSPDMQDLLEKESSDPRAAEAIALFCYQVKKTIGAYSAVLGGLDTVVFTGGIGERSPAIRSRICSGLGYLGIGLNQRANSHNDLFLSADDTRVGVYAIPTDEEWMIAKTVKHFL